MRTAFVEACQLLGRAASALAPYRNHTLVIGGMVPLLYRSVPDFAATGLPVAGTTEVDVSVPLTLAVLDGKTITQLLEAAGFIAFEAPGYRGAPGAKRSRTSPLGR